MKVIVDTSVWSLAFRRDHPAINNEVHELRQLTKDGDAIIIGSIRQELLSGIAEQTQFNFLQGLLAAYLDEPLTEADFELGASCFNQCRKKGVQGGHTDFLICAVAIRRKFSIFTVDKDFANYAKVLPIKLHKIRAH